MSTKTRSDLPPVFILEMVDHGYSIAKSLGKHGIKIVGFFPSNRSFEYFSRLAFKKYVIPKTDKEKIGLLIHAAKEFSLKPILILNSDTLYPFIYQHLNTIKQYFSIELPNETTLNLLLEKDLFNEFALKNNIQIPVSIEISRNKPINQQLFDHLQFPLVIKPKFRSPEWNEKYQSKKAFVTQTPEETVNICRELLNIDDRLVIQEWVPGPDSNVYFCLTYITEQGQVLEAFCGQKVHQHPILFGNTSSAIPIENETIEKETLRILKLSGTSGFCAVEFKKHERTGAYYVIEPAVGRINRQQYVSAVSNRDVVLRAYCHLANIPLIKKKTQSDNFIYIEESLQLKAYLDYRHYKSDERLKFRQIMKRRKIKFMHLTIKDPITSLLVIGGLVKHFLHYLIKGKTIEFQEDKVTRELISYQPEKSPAYQPVE